MPFLTGSRPSGTRAPDHGSHPDLRFRRNRRGHGRRFGLAAQRLRMALALTPQVAFQPGWGAQWVSSVCVVVARSPVQPFFCFQVAIVVCSDG